MSECKCNKDGLVCAECGGDIDVTRLTARIAELEAENKKRFADIENGLLFGKPIRYWAELEAHQDAIGHADIIAELATCKYRLRLQVDENARLTAELAELRERFEVTDDLLNQATVTIGAVIACCTYNSNEDAKIGIYGISPDAFTRIDQFITNYNRAVSAGKVSVDVKRELSDAEINELGAQEAERKEFCPNCEAETPCTHEAELFVCDICGEDFAKYIVSRNCNVSDVSMTQDVLTDVETPRSIENTNPDYYKEEIKVLLDDLIRDARDYEEALNIGRGISGAAYACNMSREKLEAWMTKAAVAMKSKDIVIASHEGRINKLTLDLLQIKGLYIKGGDGSHREGCEDVHWDCKIAHLEAELARRDEIIRRLKEDAEALACAHIVKYNSGNWECNLCENGFYRTLETIEHDDKCPVALHRALMKELEKEATDADN